MRELGTRLKRAREEAGYESATDAAKSFGWNENTYRSAENGQRPPSRAAVVKYARAFKVSVDWLLTGREPRRPGLGGARDGIALRQIPIMRWSDVASSRSIQALIASAETRGFIVVPEAENTSRDAFALEILDDSMVDPGGSPQSLYPGDTVIINPDIGPAPGSMILARHGKGAVIRRLRIVSEAAEGVLARIALVPLNPDYPTKDASSDSVVGVITGFYRRATR